MANGLRVVPKIDGNIIGIFVHMPSTGETRQVAMAEMPLDYYQLNDDMEFAEEICKAYRRRINKSINL